MSPSSRSVAPGVTETASSLVIEQPNGQPLSLRKPWCEAGVPVPAEEPRWPEEYFDEIMGATSDLLGERVLAQGEPSYEAVADLLPPLLDYSFTGCEGTLIRPVVDARGRVEGLDGTADSRCRPRGPSRWGWLGGRPPVLCVLTWEADGPTESLIFTAPGTDGRAEIWFRQRRWPNGEPEDTFRRSGTGEACAGRFYTLLAEVHLADPSAQGLPVELPEADVVEAAGTMLALARLTFRGVLPRYGVGGYDLEMHNSFPPALLSLAETLLAWGETAAARNLVDHYLSRYARPDGTLDYYGPALAEYGQLLTLIALIVQRTDAWPWFRARLPLVRPLWRRLLDLQERSRATYAEEPRHCCLIPGLPEADYHGDEAQWKTFYYSGDVWVARGLLSMGSVLESASLSGLRAEGALLSAAGSEHRAAVVSSLSQVMGDSPDYVPPGPDQPEPLTNLTANTHASYCNYRYFPEMLSAGVLPEDVMRRALRWRRHHGGEVLGMTRFGHQLDDWPAAHYARALLETDEADRYLLLLYSHWAHHCGRGHLASYEQVSLRPDEQGRRYAMAGQVVPCQVQVPLMLRWALLYEDRDANRLWLCRAIPRRWLQARKRVALRPLPTRFGEVGFTLEMSTDEAGTCVLTLPPAPLEAEIRLRLRAPGERRLTGACHGDTPLSVTDDTVRLPAGLSGAAEVRFTLARR